MILMTKVSKTKYQDIGVSGREIIKDLSKDNHLYLERHRELI